MSSAKYMTAVEKSLNSSCTCQMYNAKNLNHTSSNWISDFCRGRNRQCVTVDLKEAEGHAVVKALADRTDVLVELSPWRDGGVGMSFAYSQITECELTV